MHTEKPRWSDKKQLEDTAANGAAKPILGSPWVTGSKERKHTRLKNQRESPIAGEPEPDILIKCYPPTL